MDEDTRRSELAFALRWLPRPRSQLLLELFPRYAESHDDAYEKWYADQQKDLQRRPRRATSPFDRAVYRLEDAFPSETHRDYTVIGSKAHRRLYRAARSRLRSELTRRPAGDEIAIAYVCFHGHELEILRTCPWIELFTVLTVSVEMIEDPRTGFCDFRHSARRPSEVDLALAGTGPYPGLRD
jgi:hypothetical protein